MNKQITFWEAAHIARISPRPCSAFEPRGRLEGCMTAAEASPAPSACRGSWWSRCCSCIARSISISVCGTFTKSSARSMSSPTLHCIKRMLQGAGLVSRARKRGKHRRKRERRPMVGMLLHIYAARTLAGGEQWHDLLVVLDDAAARSTMRSWWSRIDCHVLPLCARWSRSAVFCALYSDRGSHFWLTPKE